MFRIARIFALWLIASCCAHALMIGKFPGLSKLTEEADAIVVLRIDKSTGDFGGADFYSTHDCYVYQSLKGQILRGERVRIRLMDARSLTVSIFGPGRTFLVFLTKKRNPEEPTEFRSLETEGASIRIPSTGQEKLPEGDSTEDKIRYILKIAMEANSKEYQREEDFLNGMIGGPPETR